MKGNFSKLFAFLLFTLMFFKVSAFHVYTHLDSDSNEVENCKTCELAVENQNAEHSFLVAQTVKIPFNTIPVIEQPIAYESVVSSSFLRNNFFGRPPPNVG